jgi:hypothetical protein
LKKGLSPLAQEVLSDAGNSGRCELNKKRKKANQYENKHMPDSTNIMKTMNPSTVRPRATFSQSRHGAILLPLRASHRSKFAQFQGLAATLLALPLFAQGWYTVDDFQYSPGIGSFANALAKDPTGTIIYAAGEGDDSSTTHALAFKSTDGGTNWSLMDDYVDSTGNASYIGIAVGSAGSIYAVDGRDWVTRRSTDEGVTWSTVDTVASLQASGLAIDAAGNVYVIGGIATNGGAYLIVRKGVGGTNWATMAFPARSAGESNADPPWASGVFCHPRAGIFVVGQQFAPKQAGTLNNAWTVWRSQDGGQTWVVIDTFQLSSKEFSYATGGGVDKTGNIYVVGVAGGPVKGLQPSLNFPHWVVRKTADGGNTWSTADDFLPKPYNSALPSPQAFGSDANGNLVVAGNLSWGGLPPQWLVRQSLAGTGTWQTVDTFQYASGQGAYPYAVMGDSSGHIFVAGYADASVGQHWIVRKHN